MYAGLLFYVWEASLGSASVENKSVWLRVRDGSSPSGRALTVDATMPNNLGGAIYPYLDMMLENVTCSFAPGEHFTVVGTLPKNSSIVIKNCTMRFTPSASGNAKVFGIQFSSGFSLVNSTFLVVSCSMEMTAQDGTFVGIFDGTLKIAAQLLSRITGSS